MVDTPEYDLFKSCLAQRLIPALQHQEADELDEFISYLATETFLSLPSHLQTASPAAAAAEEETHDQISESLHPPQPVIDTLLAYNLSPDPDSAHTLLAHTLSAYLSALSSLPPEIPKNANWKSTRTESCQICTRTALPLTYHHLIPRSTHAKVLKRGWHSEDVINSVAWLCRPCHSMVHHVAPNDTLAREFYTLDRLLARDDIQRWAAYAARQRSGARWSQDRETAFPSPVQAPSASDRSIMIIDR